MTKDDSSIQMEILLTGGKLKLNNYLGKHSLSTVVNREEDTKVAYLEKARCIIEQYGNYTEPNVDLKLNGINTQGENIADNGGIKEAYLAYKKYVKQNGQEQKLPGLNYTTDQLFWISAAQTWCSVYRPEAMKMRITTGVHSPGMFRVLGPMSNMKEFSNDFQCPEGSPMNPVSKCEVW